MDYHPMHDERNPDTNQNHECDLTFGPQFIGPPESFDNGVVEDNLTDVAIMWYRMYPEVIRGVVRLEEEVFQGGEL